MVQGLQIKALGREDGKGLARFLNRQPDSYRSDFHPFSNESADSISELLRLNEKDRFRAILFGEVWVAFFMLRGWEEGYDRPSFGVMVDHEWGSRGLGKFCLVSALTECRLLEVDQVMLKVASKNVVATALYEKAGFRRDSVCSATGHDVMTIDL